MADGFGYGFGSNIIFLFFFLLLFNNDGGSCFGFGGKDFGENGLFFLLIIFLVIFCGCGTVC